jgi:hypothetical protein
MIAMRTWTGVPQRSLASFASPYQPLFSSNMLQTLFTFLGGLDEQPVDSKRASISKGNRTLITTRHLVPFALLV